MKPLAIVICFLAQLKFFHLQCLIDMKVGSNYFFLKYINDSKTEWHVYLGVPFGKTYWQVGDSKEQNGSFNMPKTKKELINLWVEWENKSETNWILVKENVEEN